jgi:hypothetical protein
MTAILKVMPSDEQPDDNMSRNPMVKLQMTPISWDKTKDVITNFPHR